jgi:hypothetical protein
MSALLLEMSSLSHIFYYNDIIKRFNRSAALLAVTARNLSERLRNPRPVPDAD